MAHFRGANNTTFEKRESSSQNFSSSSSSNTSNTVTRGYQAQAGGVMDNFGGVRYAAPEQQPPVQYQQQPQYQQLPPPQQQGPPQVQFTSFRAKILHRCEQIDPLNMEVKVILHSLLKV